MKQNQCMPEDAGWRPIDQFCEIPVFAKKFAETDAQNTPFFHDFEIWNDSAKYTYFPRN